MATLSDGTSSDVTASTEGTTYTSSNPTIATVGEDGLVTAGSQSGTAIVSVTNDGVFASKIIAVILDNDTDGDGLPNDFELANGLDPNNSNDATQDPDVDGLTNIEEFNIGTELFVADTDGDGLNDGAEVAQGTNPTNPDSDLDGLLDGAEIAQGSNPLNPDSDNDGLNDGVEVALVGNPFGANPFADNDGDGLNNLDEIQLFTDPNNPDTDGDGLTDGEEVLAGTDPLVPDSISPLVSLTNPLQGAELIEGETIPITVDATDDGRVSRVDFLVDGSVVGSDTTAPFAFAFAVPSGVTALTFGATAVDTNNNVGTAPGASVSVIPDPLTTVIGFVVDVDSLPVEGVTLTTNGDVPGITLADGSFEIPNVPTVVGDIVVRASKTIAGEDLLGTSAALLPVLGGITDVGNVVVTPFPELAFVVNRGSGTVAVVDTATRQIIKEIEVGDRTTSLAVTLDGQFIYVTNTISNTISVIEVASQSVVDTITALGSPWGIDITPDGQFAYVSDVFQANVGVLRLSDNTFVQTITDPSLDTPQGVAITPDGSHVYVANVAFQGNPVFGGAPESVTVIETATNSVVTAVDVSAFVSAFGPWDVTALPDGKKVYSNDGDNGQNIFEIDSDSASPTFNQLTVINIGFGSPRGMESGVTPVGVRVYAGLAESDEVLVIDPATNEVVDRVDTGPSSFPWRVRLTPDGTQLWVSLRNTGEVLVLDTVTNTEIVRIPGFNRPNDIIIFRGVTP